MPAPRPPQVQDFHLLGTNGLLQHILQLDAIQLATFISTGRLDLRLIAEPPTPPLGRKRFYVDLADGLFKCKDDQGNVTIVGAGGSAIDGEMLYAGYTPG